MAKRRIKENKRLFKEARDYLVAGVDSPVRSFAYVGGEPVLIKEGKGSKVYDYDGKEYIDYVLSYGAAMLGHADPVVVRDLKHAAGFGFSFGATNRSEVMLARAIRQAISFAQKIRFVNSGTEAVMGAVRLARGYTSKDKIVKFANSYHGHADYLLTKGGSGLASLGIPSSRGVPKDYIKGTIIAPSQDSGYLDRIFRRYGRDIAAVIVEPVGANYGVIPPDPVFLKKLRRITQKYGSLLIFDEIITGFRFHYGAVASTLGITPDLICLGKIIGGGLPIGAYGGMSEIMEHLAPLGGVYQASTFAGNPIVMQTGLSTLRVLKGLKDDYDKQSNLTKYLASSIKAEAVSRSIDLEIIHYGSMFSIKFKKKKMFSRFYHEMLKMGIYFVPSEFEANFLSFKHTIKDVDMTIGAARLALSRI